MNKLVLALLSVVLLQGCEGGNGAPGTVVVQGQTINNDALLSDPEKYRVFISDTTFKDWDRFHGTQVEYHSADGQVWLVYPGNTRSVRGQWDVRSRNGRAQLCYRYQNNSYNPVTGQSGGRWQCRPGLDRLLADIAVDGDVLQLKGRAAYPEPLPKRVNISLNTIKKTIGLGELKARNKLSAK